LGINANLGEAILHLKYLDDQFAEDEAKANAASSTTTAKEEFEKSSLYKQDKGVSV